MLKLDHLTVIAPSLERGVEHVHRQIGIAMPIGGKHPEMGTHNHVLRLGDDVFLEVIAIDPGAQRPNCPRWFGLDAAAEVEAAWARGDCLAGWVARTDGLAGVLARHGEILGRATQVSRGDRSWLFAVPADGSRPADGAAPSVIDWGERGTPVPAMADLGCRLTQFVLEHPDPAFVRRLHAGLGIVDGPTIREGKRLRYEAVIATPAGERKLR